MREILFRGKRADTGEWVFGMAWIFREKTMICPWKEGMCKYDTGYYPVQVMAKTFGQYTGLTDRNGKRIFEGDIVFMHLNDTVIKGVVKYQAAAFYIATDADLWDINDYITLEVIGNIHDTPDLLT